MKQKSKFRRFWNLDHRKSDGFTLIELIVVIAIMAILAGVGSVGYAGYIKSANKNADKALVGDIMRAIETGTNSLMFVNDDSFKMGKISYPVGFIALSPNSAQIVTSTTEKTEAVEGNCELITETVTYIIRDNTATEYKCHNTYDLGRWGTYGCKAARSEHCYDIRPSVGITYCKTHSAASDLPTILSSDTEYLTDYTEESCDFDWNVDGYFNHQWKDTKETVLAGTRVLVDTDGLRLGKTENRCDYAYANQYGGFTGTPTAGATTEGPLHDALVAAFGSTDNLKLKYDDWKEEDGADYATFYTSVSQLMGDIETLSGLLVVGDNFLDLGLSKEYGSSEEVLTSVASNMTTVHKNEASWMNQWMDESTMTWDAEDFGMGGRENYSAARVAYNNGFASWLDATSDTGASPYSERVRDFNSQELLGVGLPGLVCTDAFTDPDSELKNKFNKTEFEELETLYKDYLKSSAREENGRMIYNMMSTFNDTADVAKAYKNLNGGSVFDYYNSYVDEIDNLYTSANAAAGGGIVIIVTVNNGELDFQVSPAAANPRPAKTAKEGQ